MLRYRLKASNGLWTSHQSRRRFKTGAGGSSVRSRTCLQQRLMHRCRIDKSSVRNMPIGIWRHRTNLGSTCKRVKLSQASGRCRGSPSTMRTSAFLLLRAASRPVPTFRSRPALLRNARRTLLSAADIQSGQPLHETHPHLIKAGERKIEHASLPNDIVLRLGSHSRYNSSRVPSPPCRSCSEVTPKQHRRARRQRPQV